MINYGINKTLNLTIEDSEEKVANELKKEGFRVLTRINIKPKFKEKPGINFEKYIIPGACNPPFAYKSLLAEPNIGLLLPCNIIIYEHENKTILSVIKPTLAMRMINNPYLMEIANEIKKNWKLFLIIYK